MLASPVQVPTLMEGGMDGLTGIERGRMWAPEWTRSKLGGPLRRGVEPVVLRFAEVEAGPGLASTKGT